MAKTTSLISYNCQSAKASLGIINNLLQKCDILLLQETFLPTIDNTLENLFTNFNVIKIAAQRLEKKIKQLEELVEVWPFYVGGIHLTLLNLSMVMKEFVVFLLQSII